MLSQVLSLFLSHKFGIIKCNERKVRHTYRLRPGAEAKRWLHFEANNCRYLWNRLVEGVQKSNWYSDKDLTAWRKELAWLRAGSSMVQQQLFRDFKTAKGRKKFKSSHGYLPSLNYVGFGKNFHIREGKLCLPHGVKIPVVWSRELPSDPSSVRVSQDNLGHWYASFVVEVPEQTNHWAPDNSQIGIDWGLRALATTTDETFDLEHPEFAKQAHKNMVRYQRMMARRAPKPGKKASNGYKQAKRVVAKQHKKIARQRQDHGRKWVRKVVDNHQQIAIENLKPCFMFGSNLARKAGDAGLGNLKKDLIFAAERAGREVELVHPKNSSITCSECSARNKQNVHASHKRFHCLACGFKTDRDLNAARNILDTAGFNRTSENHEATHEDQQLLSRPVSLTVNNGKTGTQAELGIPFL